MKGSEDKSIKKLAVGTVQFGLDYGISNKEGKTSFHDCQKIVDLSIHHGINTLDTAFLYGNSEEVLGKLNIKDFNIVSKFPEIRKGENVTQYFNQSLKRLNCSALYAYLSHNSQILIDHPAHWEELLQLKASGQIKKIGTSLYSPDQLEKLLDMGITPDIIQIPYNVFDRRFECMFEKLHDIGIEIHSRSTFLQGLFFLSDKSLPLFLKKALPNIEYLHKRYPTKIELAGALLEFSIQNPFIDKVVIGVNNANQLNENITGLQNSNKQIGVDLRINDEKIILPFNWGHLQK